ncbi:MAG: hypothetical protein C4309_05500 [Chloroflexota bacterium]
MPWPPGRPAPPPARPIRRTAWRKPSRPSGRPGTWSTRNITGSRSAIPCSSGARSRGCFRAWGMPTPAICRPASLTSPRAIFRGSWRASARRWTPVTANSPLSRHCPIRLRRRPGCSPAMSLSPLLDAIMLVRGPAGTTVHLEVRRAGQDRLLQFDIVRARIQIASVTSRLLEGGYAYVRISTFGDRTTEELRQALQTLLAQNPKGLILDLRGNPGGNLYTALDVASQFIKDGPIMIEEWGDGRRKTFNADGRGLATGIPLMVLVDQGSASASEIVAGALRDRQRATLVGEKTFGKGSVQSWRALDEGRNGGVRITIARWLTPNGRWVHEAGLTPDILVVRSPEDVQAGRDPQLEAALNALKLLSQSSMAVGRQDAP